jgi:hypothetical protein
MLTLRRSTPLLAIVLLSALALAGQQPTLAAARATTIAPAPNLITNGTFSSGTSSWSVFASPASAIEFRVNNGVFEWNRTTDASTQAAILQNTGVSIAHSPVEATFDIGNSANTRQRMSVLVLDADFSDVSVCTFWLDAFAPLRTYRMRTHPTKPWTNAAIYFYAATTASQASHGGFLRLDNVTLSVNATGSDTSTECVDPTVPPPPGGVESASLVLNGDFNQGMSFWQTYGTITSAVAGGVFLFIRNPGQPAGVMFQQTGASVAPNEFLTARFDLGNSSLVRKRVTVVVHANDFSDLAACTFWLPPSLPRLPFVMRMRATRAWNPGPLTGATLSVYGATVGADVWMELDNVTLTRSPGAAIQGTECIEPDLGAASTAATTASSRASIAATPGAAAPRTTDANGSAGALGGVTSWMADASAPIEVQTSRDGEHWLTVARVPPGGDWTDVELALGEVQGEAVRVRLVYALPAATPAGWRVISLRIVR